MIYGLGDMIRDGFEFFKKEKFYTLLFLAIVTYVGYQWMVSIHAQPEPAYSSQAFREFRTVEEKFHEEIRKAESFEHYLQENPDVRTTYEALFSVFIAVFLAGLLLSTIWVFTPGFRSKLSVTKTPPKTEWKLSMLFKVLILFLILNFPLGILIGFLEHALIPKVSSNLVTLFHTTLIDLLGIGLIFWVIARSGGNWRDMGVPQNRRQLMGDFLAGWGGYLAVMPIFLLTLFTLVILSQLFGYEPPPHPLVNVFLEEDKKSPMTIIYSLFLAGCLGPILEEIFFRGFCYSIFKKRFGIIWGMILSSGFFAYIHMNQFSFLPIFILGMALVYLCEIRKSLAAPIVLHITHNSVFMYYFFAMKDLVITHAPV